MPTVEDMKDIRKHELYLMPCGSQNRKESPDEKDSKEKMKFPYTSLDLDKKEIELLYNNLESVATYLFNEDNTFEDALTGDFS